MASEWTLPLIQAELDQLPLGCDFILAPDDVERLFGTGGTIARQLANFAIAHGCRTAFRGQELVFQKRLQRAASDPAFDFSPVECYPPAGPAPCPAEDDHPGPGCH